MGGAGAVLGAAHILGQVKPPGIEVRVPSITLMYSQRLGHLLVMQTISYALVNIKKCFGGHSAIRLRACHPGHSTIWSIAVILHWLLKF